MIRLIQRRLVIPRGDTGTFTIPTQGSVEANDVAVFSIYDPLTHLIVCEKIIPATENTLTFTFTHDDTVNIEPSDRYQWDIKIYHSPEYDEDHNLIGGAEINSYYAAFGKKMPKCVIKQVAQDGSYWTIDENSIANIGTGSSIIRWADIKSKPTTLAGYGIEDAVSITEFNALKSQLTGVYKYAGSVADVAALNAIVNPNNGDVYNVETDGMNYAWNESLQAWDPLGTNIDLSNYVRQEELTAIRQECSTKLTSVAGKDNSITVTNAREISVQISNAADNALELIETEGEQGLYVAPIAPVHQKNEKLIFGGYGHYVYDGSTEVTVPVYTGEYI